MLGSADAHAVVRELSGYPDAFSSSAPARPPTPTCSTSPPGAVQRLEQAVAAALQLDRFEPWVRVDLHHYAEPLRPIQLRCMLARLGISRVGCCAGVVGRSTVLRSRRAGYQVVQSRGNLVCVSSRASCSCHAGCSSTTFMSRLVAAASSLRPRVVMRHVS
jgi:hypothetical protein